MGQFSRRRSVDLLRTRPKRHGRSVGIKLQSGPGRSHHDLHYSHRHILPFRDG